MNKSYYFSIISILLFFYISTSCHPDNETRFENVSDIPVLTVGDTVWSLYNVNGSFINDNLPKGFPSLVINNHFSIINDGKISLYRMDEIVEEVKGCNDLKCVGVFQDGLIPVTFPNSRIKLLDYDGDVVFELKPYNGTEIYSCSLSFSEGLLRIISVDGLYGYCDTKGEYVIPPKYTLARNFHEDVAIVELPETDSESTHRAFSVIDREGKVLFTLDKDIIPQTYDFSYGRIIVNHLKRGIGYVDKNGIFYKLPNNPTGVGQYDDNYFTFADKNGYWGVSDYKGRLIINPKYESIKLLPDQSFLTEDKNFKFYILDRTNNIKMKFENVTQVKYYKNLGFLVRNKDGISILNTNAVRSYDKYFSEVSLEKSVSTFIKSDVFNTVDPFEQFIQALSSHGVGKYILKHPVYRVLSEKPEEYISSRKISDKQIFYNDGKGKYTFEIYTDKPISLNKQDESNRIEYNEGARIIGMRFKIKVSPKEWEKQKMKYSLKVNNKGFNLVKTVVKNGRTLKLYQTITSELVLIEDPQNKEVSIILLADREALKVRKQLFGHN